jgi:nitric oxide reductase subunit B
MQHRALWLALTGVIVVSFAVLLVCGAEIYVQAPPVPDVVKTTAGQIVCTGQEIRDGQNVWQSIGGQELGTIWGHGAYVAPDWTADRLHREALGMLDHWAAEYRAPGFAELSAEQQAALQARLATEVRHNTYDPATRELTISPLRYAVYSALERYYSGLFGADPQFNELRRAYAMPPGTITGAKQQRDFNAFLFWAAWACCTDRPGEQVSYTNNWPPDKLFANQPAGSIILWTGFSVMMLIAGIGALAWFRAAQPAEAGPAGLPKEDALGGLALTPSMKSVFWYFVVATILLVVQILMGVLAAHYAVEGSGFYGIPLQSVLPYTVVRTWHLQLGLFWIATAWLATGLYIAALLAGKDPPWQRAGVNLLLACLIIIVGGSMAGEWLSVQHKLAYPLGFWLGHQGFEYVDLGRVWQIALFAGLLLWLTLMLRALLPAMAKAQEKRPLLLMFVVSCAAIALFYGAGFFWGRQTNLAIAEYWRWWVVHLWVEGFFEVFATTVIALVFVQLGLLRASSATAAVLLSSSIYLAGGIIGTLHHLYFTGTPTGVIALGATFSALEVVPLVLIGFEAFENWKLSRATPWLVAYRWPLYFLVAVAFWNLLGAGIFGFLINTPIALYYMQGLNTTPLHGHTALFGVYGNLGLGLMLICLKGSARQPQSAARSLGFAFWAINIGLLLMALLSLLPVGLIQTVASVEHGMWYARSAELLDTPLVATFRWLRVIGDTVFAVGAAAYAWYVARLVMDTLRLRPAAPAAP